MSSYDEILNQIPMDELAAQFGVDRNDVQQAAQSALPALIGGLKANAADPASADSLMSALSDHQAPITGLGDVDVQDGEAIVGNIFGDNTDQVVNQLGGLGGIGGSGGSGGSGGGLVQKLLPILAPIVLSWLASKMSQGGGLGGMLGGGTSSGQAPADGGALFSGGQGAGSGPVQSSDTAGGSSNPLEDILGQVLGGAGGGASGDGAGDLLGGIVGGLLGGGKR